jgi:hypothetical protein
MQLSCDAIQLGRPIISASPRYFKLKYSMLKLVVKAIPWRLWRGVISSIFGQQPSPLAILGNSAKRRASEAPDGGPAFQKRRRLCDLLLPPFWRAGIMKFARSRRFAALPGGFASGKLPGADDEGNEDCEANCREQA